MSKYKITMGDLITCLILGGGLSCPCYVFAGISTDGTVGPSTSLSGPDYQITDSLGTTVGTNLFHSFHTFSIAESESATFSGPDGIKNIISRVTGGDITSIDGPLRSEVGTASFYFLNPAGIVFGENAKLNVPGDFHVSTADGVRFADGALFSSSLEGSTLTSSLPESFAYLKPQAARIEFNGCELSFAQDAKVSLSGGELEFTNSTVRLENGELRISAMGDVAGTVSLDGDLADQGSGDVSLFSTDLDTGGNGGGFISLNGGDMTVNSSDLNADNEGSIDREGGIRIKSSKLTIVDSWLTADAHDEGNAGTVDIRVDGLLELINGGQISSSTWEWAIGDAGSVTVKAGQMTIDGQGEYEQFTGIWSEAYSYFAGTAGTVDIRVDGLLELMNGAQISSSTWTTGDAGSVTVKAGQMTIDGHGEYGQFTGIWSDAESYSEGNGGRVDITVAGQLELLNGAEISSSIWEWTTGDAGSVVVKAGQLKIDGNGLSGELTGIWTDAESYSLGTAGTVDIRVDGLMELLNGAEISSSIWQGASGDAGSVTVNAGQLKIDDQGVSGQSTGIISKANSGSEGNAGIVTITVDGLLELLNGSQISSSTFASGDAGGVTVNAGQLKIDDQGLSGQLTGIISNANSGSGGNAGTVVITVGGLLELSRGAEISSNTFATGNAGSVTVNTSELKIDDQATADQFTGIASTAESGSRGNAGTVVITVAGLLEMINGAQISSSTRATGNAGSVTVNAGELKIDDQGVNGQLTGISSKANSGSEGNAGTVAITVAGQLELTNGAQISSSTSAPGDAGSVTVNAGELKIDDQGVSGQLTGITSNANSGSSGNAGTVEITIDGLLELINGAEISSNTFALGNAGSVTVNAGELKIDDQGLAGQFTGIASTAESGSVGTAGSVVITVDGLLELINGAKISSSARATGNAGSITVNAKDLYVTGESTGIYSFAADTATGYVGDITINCHSMALVNGGKISISASQTLPEDRLAQMEQNAICITSDNLSLNHDSKITAESRANVPAGAINIQSHNAFVENSSHITTTSNDANGGPITIQGDMIFLGDGLITTSVEGTSGDGGDITIMGIGTDESVVPADFLILKGGVIQANTGAAQARGGDIFLDTENIFASSNILEIGGTERYQFTAHSGLNIIQAAAPGGEQGIIRLSTTPLDLSGSLESLESDLTEPLQLATDPCNMTGKEEASSLVFSGKRK